MSCCSDTPPVMPPPDVAEERWPPVCIEPELTLASDMIPVCCPSWKLNRPLESV